MLLVMMVVNQLGHGRGNAAGLNSGVAGDSSKVEPGPINLLFGLVGFWLLRFGRIALLRTLIARYVLVLVNFDSPAIQTLAGEPLGFVAIGEDVVLSNFFVIHFRHCASTASLTCCHNAHSLWHRGERCLVELNCLDSKWIHIIF